MRDHLATLLDDFRRFGREIAGGALPGQPAPGHHLRRVGAAGRALCGAAGGARHRARRPGAAVGREQRGVDRGLPWLHAARGAGGSAGRDRDRGVCRARGGRREAETGGGRRRAAGAVARGVAHKLAFEDWLAVLPAGEAGPVEGLSPRRRCKFCSPPAPPASPRALCLPMATCWPAWGPSRTGRSPICAGNGWCIRCAFCTRCR